MARQPKVVIIELNGVLADSGKEGNVININNINPLLQKAFQPRFFKTDLVVLNISSPGGSPAHSEAIAKMVRHLSQQSGIPVIAFIMTAGASGGYWLATAADEIYALESSLVGSIGVIAGYFNVSELITKYGISRRVLTKGAFKGGPDMFQPVNEKQEDELKRLMSVLADSFYNWVKARREAKLKIPEEEIFNGRVWTGVEAKNIGLIDGIGLQEEVLSKRYPGGYNALRLKPKTRSRLFGQMSASIAASVADAVVDVLQERFGGVRFF